MLLQLADGLRSGRLPFMFGHDPTRPIAVRVVDAVVEDDGVGYERVRVRFEVEKAAWRVGEDEWKAAGVSGGFSWSGSMPIASLPALGDSPKPTIGLAADAHFWTRGQILDAADQLRGEANVEAAERFAFSHIPDPVVVITLVEVVKAVGAAALWDSIKTFFAHARGSSASPQETILEFRIVESGPEVIGRVKTDDAEVLRHAIDAL
jgi:hypothetical protein